MIDIKTYEDNGKNYKYYIKYYTVHHSPNVPYFYDNIDVAIEVLDNNNNAIGEYIYKIHMDNCNQKSHTIYDKYRKYALYTDGLLYEPKGPSSEDVLALFKQTKGIN